jgi:SAM-dependent methyltransferase
MRSAEDFDQFYATPDPWGVKSARFRSRAYQLSLAPYIDGRSVLELGCGEGHLTRAALYSAKSVLGIDISAVAIERARSRQPANATFLAADFMKIPFEGFDVVTVIECLYYLSEEERAALLEKVTKEHSGRIVALSAPVVGLFEDRRYFTHAEIMALLSRHGLKLIEYRNIVPRWDSPAKHMAAIAVKNFPFGHALIDYLPDSLIYQRCYLVRA